MNALACGACMVAGAGYALPSIYWWMLLGALWLLYNGWALKGARDKPPFSPGLVVSLVFVLAAFLTIPVAGPLVALVCFLVALSTFLWGKGAKEKEKMGSGPWLRLKRGGLVFALLSFLLFGWDAYQGVVRTPADYINRWGQTAPAKSAFYRLYGQEPGSYSEYEKIIREGSGWSAVKAAERLLEKGQFVDPSWVRGAIERTHRPTPKQTLRNILEQVLTSKAGSGPS